VYTVMAAYDDLSSRWHVSCIPDYGRRMCMNNMKQFA